MLLGVPSLFEMHPPFMHVYLVARLCTLGSGGTTRIQTDPHPLALKPVSVSETLLCLKSICLTNFLTLEALPALVLKGFLSLPFLSNKIMLLNCPLVHGLLYTFGICKMKVSQILPLSVLVYLCAEHVLLETILLLMSSQKKPPTCP